MRHFAEPEACAKKINQLLTSVRYGLRTEENVAKTLIKTSVRRITRQRN